MKQKNRDYILKFLEELANNSDKGCSTSEISKQLMMQRTNVSKILNELVDEGLVEKEDNCYPVLYKRSNKLFKIYNDNSFKKIIGWNKSLKKCIQQAKSAIQYPNKSLNVLIVADEGTGKSMLSKTMYEYSKEVGILNDKAKYVKLNCLYYKDDKIDLKNKFLKALENANNGILYIDNCQYLDSDSKNILSSLLENGFFEFDGTKQNSKTMIICSVSPSIMAMDQFVENISSKFYVKIELPLLNERTYEEKIELIELFLINEAVESGCEIYVGSEVMIALALYPYKNVKQLNREIKQACAIAYVRNLPHANDKIELFMTDFNASIRSGLLNYKNLRSKIDELIKTDSNYIFNSKDFSVVKENNKLSIYDWINEKSNELKNKGFTQCEIGTMINAGIENELNKYKKNTNNEIISREQLSQMVNQDIINLVDEFLEEAAVSLKRYFSMSVKYGLCLHIQALIDGRSIASSFKGDKIMAFINENKDEYLISSNFSEILNKNFDLNLSVDETIMIAMFLTQEEKQHNNNPSILIAMHGLGIAKALSETIRNLNECNIEYYDMPLNKKPIDAYEEIKNKLLNIPNENGILVIYDMGSLKEIFNMISIETGIKIKLISFPYTLLLLDITRKVSLSKNIDEAYEEIFERYKCFNNSPIQYDLGKKGKAIITTCMTGEGGAKYLKKYLQNNYNVNDIDIIPLKMNEQNKFMMELNKITKTKDILCIVGAQNPNIYGIPFVSIEKIFSKDGLDMKKIIDKNEIEIMFRNNANAIYEHLDYEIKNVDSKKLKEEIVKFIISINDELKEKMEMNEMIGLLVHMSCMVDRLSKGEKSAVNINKEQIINKNVLLFKVLNQYIMPLEETFKVKIDDDEMSNLIMIITKTKK